MHEAGWVGACGRGLLGGARAPKGLGSGKHLTRADVTQELEGPVG